jgi:hypothetical protein
LAEIAGSYGSYSTSAAVVIGSLHGWIAPLSTARWGCQQRLDPVAQLGSALRSNASINKLTLIEQEQSRYALHPEPGGRCRALVDIHLDEFHSTAKLRSHLLKRWRNHAARTTPRGPEIDHDRKRRVFHDR